METHINLSAISVVLILMAAASLFTMLSLNQINYIVHGDLYNFGLKFSYRWAMPYWVLSGIVFGLSWMNIVLAIIVTLYILKRGRKQNLSHESIPQNEEMEATKKKLKKERGQQKLGEFLESQKGEVTELKEGLTETASKELIEEEIKEHEETTEAEVHEAQQTPTEEKKPQEEIEPSKETEEIPIPTEDAEQRQSIL